MLGYLHLRRQDLQIPGGLGGHWLFPLLETPLQSSSEYAIDVLVHWGEVLVSAEALLPGTAAWRRLTIGPPR